MQKPNKRRPARRRTWARLLAVLAVVMLVASIGIAYNQWRYSLPVSHTHHDSMTVQLDLVFDEHNHLEDAISKSGDSGIRYRRFYPDMGSDTSYVDVTLEGKTVEIIGGLEAPGTYDINIYPDTAHPGKDDCSSSLQLEDETAKYFEDCHSRKEERSSLGMSHTQQEKLARRACWKLIDTAYRNW